MGRADQRTKVSGMFVDPKQIAAVLKRHPEIAKARLIVVRRGAEDAMVLEVEPLGDGRADEQALAATLSDVTKLRGEVVIRPAGSLPNDGRLLPTKGTMTHKLWPVRRVRCRSNCFSNLKGGRRCDVWSNTFLFSHSQWPCRPVRHSPITN